MTPEDKARNLESFKYVWSTIRDKHWDAEMGGLSWDSLKTVYQERVENAASKEEVRIFLSGLISELETSHYSIIPEEIYKDMDIQEGRLAKGHVGLTPVIIDGQVYVRDILPHSPADDAGIKMGWEILSINGELIPSTLAKVSPEFKGKSWHDGVLLAVVESKLNGSIGAAITLVCRDKHDAMVKKKLTFVEKSGHLYQWGYLPKLYVRSKIDTIDGNIGYIAFNMFLDPVHLVPRINKAMLDFRSMDGLVFDLRGNEGGMAEIGMGIAGWLVTEKQHYFGQMITQHDTLKLVVNPRPMAFQGRVAVLVDEGSASSSEFFAGGLQDMGRAKIFGTKTAGAALPSQIERLKNGDSFQYVFANYITCNGALLEGNGVVPDVTISHTRESLRAGRDVVLEAAVAWINGYSSE